MVRVGKGGVLGVVGMGKGRGGGGDGDGQDGL